MGDARHDRDQLTDAILTAMRKAGVDVAELAEWLDLAPHALAARLGLRAVWYAHEIAGIALRLGVKATDLLRGDSK